MKTHLMMLAAIITLCGTTLLTSCVNEENSQESRQWLAKIQNTHWQMTEIFALPNRESYEPEWIPAGDSNYLMIYDLSFDDKGHYSSNDMHNSFVVGRDITKHSGEYHVVGTKIYMHLLKTEYAAHGNYNLTIRDIKDNIMEAVVGWIPNYDYYDDGYGDYQMNMELDRDNMEYLIRLKRMPN